MLAHIMSKNHFFSNLVTLNHRAVSTIGNIVFKYSLKTSGNACPVINLIQAYILFFLLKM